MSEIIYQEFGELYEKQGVWCYNEDPNDSRSFDEKQANRIYTYVRLEIIKQLNAKINSFSINVPDNLRYINSKMLRKLVVVYQPDTDKIVKMSVVKKKGICNLIINIDIFDPEFKYTFMHEMKHYWQISFGNLHFVHRDYSELIKSDENNNKLVPLMLLVYKNSPAEYAAYKEQIYTKIYNFKSCFNYSLNDIKEICLNEMYLSEYNLRYIITILNKKPNDEMKRYLLRLFLDNIDEIGTSTHNYRLFSEKDYNREYIKQIRQAISSLTQYPVIYIYKAIDEFIEMLIEDDSLIDSLFRVFKKRLLFYIDKNKKDLNKFVDLVYSIVEGFRKESKYKTTTYSLYNFILNDNDNKYVEFEISNLGYMFALKGKSLNEIYLKFLILKMHLEDSKYSKVDFVFRNVFNQDLKYKMNKFPEDLVYDIYDDINLSSDYQRLNDIKKIIQQLNDKNLTKYLHD